MSKNDMVMVPRTSLEDVLSIDAARTTAALERFRATLSQPAPQGQGEPVGPIVIEVKDACVYLRSGPLAPGQYQLYTQADPDEVDQHIARRMELAEQKTELYRQIEALRAQLAEAQALLREVDTSGPIGPYPNSLQARIKSALSASAEPKCGKCHGRGLLRIATVCGPADKSCPECASAEPSAPECKCDMRTKLVGDGCATCNPERAADLIETSALVEIDERAALEAYCAKVGLPLDVMPTGEYLIPATRFVSQGWHAHAAATRQP